MGPTLVGVSFSAVAIETGAVVVAVIFIVLFLKVGFSYAMSVFT